jgi:3D (Asp-Asp-Asp) domain-containing protein
MQHPAVSLFALVMVVVTGLAVTGWANALYILTGVDQSDIVLDGTQEIPDLSDRMIRITTGGKGYDIRMVAGSTVTIQRDGYTWTTESKRNETISALLKRMDIVLSPLEMVAFDLSTPNEVKINIDEEITCYEVTREEAPYNTVRVANPDMLKGTERVVQEGVVGIRSSVYEVVWSGGMAISRQFVEEIDSTAVDEIIEYGTSADEVSRDDKLVEVKKNEDGSGTLVFASGTTVNFSGTKSMTATAYTAGHGGVDYTTATGSFVKHGVVAVDKRVIPLGTRMYIVTNDGIVYGLATAEDTGVRGNVIDLYHETYRQCIEFGRRSCTVYILEG